MQLCTDSLNRYWITMNFTQKVNRDIGYDCSYAQIVYKYIG